MLRAKRHDESNVKQETSVSNSLREPNVVGGDAFRQAKVLIVKRVKRS